MKLKAILLAANLAIPSAFATNLNELADWMTGFFNSNAQSITNESYYDINLEMVQIWPTRDDAIWLYVEQAVSANLDKPYRQRVYKLEQTPQGTFTSTVYELPNALEYIGVWRSPQQLDGLSPQDLILRQGCHINIDKKQIDNAIKYLGSTDEKRCLSKLRGANYATSHVDIQKGVLTSWDQGFDVNEKQVWGAIEGPYIFDKVKNYPVKKS